MVRPPAARTAPIPVAPSSPMPVMSTAIELLPNSWATDWNKTSADGRCPFTRGWSTRMAMFPCSMRRTFMWRLPGQINARPANNKSPDCASFTSMAQDSLRRRANMSVKPSGICCTTKRQPGKSSGSCEKRYCKALGPPVEMPIATIREGQLGSEVRRCSLRFIEGTVIIIFGAPEAAANLIFNANSAAICSIRPEAASCGLVTKSKAPSASALRVSDALRSVCALKTITGTRCLCVIWRSISIPSMRGMSRSSVTT